MSSSQEFAFLHADTCGFSAAMAASEELSISRLKAGQALFQQTARRFGGREVDMVGDSILLAFDTVEAAFLTARAVNEAIAETRNLAIEQQPFDYRTGLTRGRVTVSDGKFYGNCINRAARIGSLVGRGNIGIEREAWADARKLVAHADVKERVLFAKPDEPFIDFFEISNDARDARDQVSREQLRNEPLVVVVPHFVKGAERQQRIDNDLLEAFLWDCTSYFGSHGWQVFTVDHDLAKLQLSHSPADYVVQCRVVQLSNDMRLSASLSSRHMRRGVQNFNRDFENAVLGTANAMALASLIGSAIAETERERVTSQRGIGSHQLVAAGRASIAGFSAEQFMVGMAHLQAAQKLDPEYPLLLSSLARAHTVAWRFGWLEQGDDHLHIARELAGRAVKLSPNDARCEADLGFVKLWANEPIESAWHYERSLDVLPYHPELAADAGMVFAYIGRNDQAAAVLERSIANLPGDADYRLWSLGDVYHAKRDYKNSLKWLSRMSDQSQAQRLMAVNKARLGLDPSSHVANVLALQPDFSVQHWTEIQPFTDENDRIEFAESLLLAGLPR